MPEPPGKRKRPARQTGAPFEKYSSSSVNKPNPIGDQADLRFRRNVRQLHQLGPRPLFEMLVELGQQRMLRSELEELVGRYAALDRDTLHAVGGDRLAPLPPPRLVRP